MTTSNARLHYRAGVVARDGYAVVVDPELAGWSYSSLRVLDLPASGQRTFETAQDEALILPLYGSAVVECDDKRFELKGRDSVFAGPTDFAYVPWKTKVTVSSAQGGRFAIPAARARRTLPARYGPVSGVPIELRGAGQCSRQVNNFCTPQAFEADRLIACEVLTPSGNWSSYPPHKHDEDRPGESVLEEVYYFEVAGGPSGPGFAYQRVYGAPHRPLDVLAQVNTGDVILVPHGWHGPSIAAPGYDLYYLNVMGGPGPSRQWLTSDDPDHTWIRDTWAGMAVDSRLPFGASTAHPGV